MADSDILIRVDGVSKRFCRDLKRSLLYGAQDVGCEAFGLDRSATPLRKAEFWANRDVSFELRRGECLGLIGRNGAGKTTLLKMLNGLIKPDTGRIDIRGRVGALIALGAGFNPILTGRENIYINGSVLGLSRREIDAKLEDIVEFSGVRAFIDTPVQSYSSGMQVRLGFAIATAMDPDVLLLDEVLAVGDAAFRHKCYHRLNRLIDRCAVVFVSHSMEQVAAISTAVGMMRQGEFELYSKVTDGINVYNQANEPEAGPSSDGGKVFACYPPVTHAELRIPRKDIVYGESLDVEIDFETTEAIEDLKLNFTALNQGEQPVMTWASARLGRCISLPAGRSILRFSIDPLHLHDGIYKWCFGMLRQGSIEHLVYAMRAGDFSVKSDYAPLENIPYLPRSASFEVVSL